jgi:hypothetical protein
MCVTPCLCRNRSERNEEFALITADNGFLVSERARCYERTIKQNAAVHGCYGEFIEHARNTYAECVRHTARVNRCVRDERSSNAHYSPFFAISYH